MLRHATLRSLIRRARQITLSIAPLNESNRLQYPFLPVGDSKAARARGPAAVYSLPDHGLCFCRKLRAGCSNALNTRTDTPIKTVM